MQVSVTNLQRLGGDGEAQLEAERREQHRHEQLSIRILLKTRGIKFAGVVWWRRVGSCGVWWSLVV